MLSDNIKEEVQLLHIRIGSNVKRIREKKGFSQKALSLEIGQESTTIISQAELSRNKHFNIEQLYKIAQVLEVELCEFFRES